MAKFLTKSASQSTIINRKQIGGMTITHTKYKGFDIAREKIKGKKEVFYVANSPSFPGAKFYDTTGHGIQTQIDKFLHGRKMRNQFMTWLEKGGKLRLK